MELSRPVLFPEEVAAHQHLAFYSAMKLGFCRLNSHIEALPMLDVNSSLLGCGTAPLQQLAHVPSMSWSTTEPTLPLNPYAWNQASFDENALIDSSCVCQEHNIARGLGNSLVLEDLTKGDDIYENLLASYMNEMSSNCTNADALVAIAQSNALLTHKHSRNDSFSGPLLESMHEYFPSHCTVQATQYILGSNFVSQSFLGQQQETAQYIFNIDSSHSRAGMQFMWPSSTQIFDSEINTDSPKENEQEKLAACFESCEQHHRAEQYPDSLQILMSDDFNPHQQFSHLQGECIPEANSAGSAVSSSVITDADTECSVHSERQLIATQLDRRHLQLDDSISFQKLSDNREAVKPFVTTNVKTSGSPLGNVAPPGKRQKGCFPLESASTSVDQHFRKSYSRELRGQSNAKKQSSQLCNELSTPHCEHALSQQPNGACNLSPTSESDMKTAQRKLCITSIEPQSIAARQRRKKISERVRTLEKLVPGGNKLDTASMLDEAIKYVKFLQLQVQILESLGNDNNAWTADAVRDKYCAENMYASGSGIQSNFGFTRGTRPTSSLVLTEIIQHQLFKSGYCLMSLQQCPRLPSQTP